MVVIKDKLKSQAMQYSLPLLMLDMAVIMMFVCNSKSNCIDIVFKVFYPIILEVLRHMISEYVYVFI